jgi:thiaminase/transcriptional activator TenA
MAIQELTSTEPTTCAELRAGVEPVWEQIYAHPFLREIEDGTLPDDKLVFYFVQNVHYIDAAIRFAAAAAARAEDPELQEHCFGLSDFGRAEVARQREYVRELPGGADADWEIAPTSHAYTRHLLTLAAYGGAEELVVGLFPCEWTYDEFSKRLAPIVHHPIHQQWLATFAGDEHSEIHDRYHTVVDRILAEASPARRARYQEIFKTSSRYEWMFWEMSYTKERWPV